MRIWKWPLQLADRQTILIPKGAQFLSSQIQGGALQIWALCNEDNPKEIRTIAIYGTGNPIPDNPGKYISTFQLDDGVLIFHVFVLEKNHDKKIIDHKTAKEILSNETAEGFGKRMAKACNEIKSSNVYFIIQQAYPEIADFMMWEDVQDLLTKILGEK